MEEKYNFKHVKAFALIALYNLLHSANKNNINLKNLDIFLDPLPQIHKKEHIEQYANMLKRKEE